MVRVGRVPVPEAMVHRAALRAVGPRRRRQPAGPGPGGGPHLLAQRVLAAPRRGTPAQLCERRNGGRDPVPGPVRHRRARRAPLLTMRSSMRKLLIALALFTLGGMAPTSQAKLKVV